MRGGVTHLDVRRVTSVSSVATTEYVAAERVSWPRCGRLLHFAPYDELLAVQDLKNVVGVLVESEAKEVGYTSTNHTSREQCLALWEDKNKVVVALVAGSSCNIATPCFQIQLIREPVHMLELRKLCNLCNRFVEALPG